MPRGSRVPYLLGLKPVGDGEYEGHGYLFRRTGRRRWTFQKKFRGPKVAMFCFTASSLAEAVAIVVGGRR